MYYEIEKVSRSDILNGWTPVSASIQTFPLAVLATCTTGEIVYLLAVSAVAVRQQAILHILDDYGVGVPKVDSLFVPGHTGIISLIVVTWRHMESQGVSRHNTASQSVAGHHRASHGVTGHHMASHGTTLHHTAIHGVTLIPKSRFKYCSL